jgi:CheY-like chemotaxis protein
MPSDALSVLVVDDDSMIAMMMADILRDFGCNVVGPAGSVAKSIALIERGTWRLDGAFLDVNLRGELVYPVADVLTARAVPFVFATGYSSHGIDGRYISVRALAKPFTAPAIDSVVQNFVQCRRVRLDRQGTPGWR